MTHVDRIRKIVKLNLNFQCWKSSLCDYSDAYILVKWTISVAPQKGGNTNNGHKEMVFKNCIAFIYCISQINNTQIYIAKRHYVFMRIYNLIEYSDNYLENNRNTITIF